MSPEDVPSLGNTFELVENLPERMAFVLGPVFTGLVAGVIMVFSVHALEHFGIDDPVAAISVHGTAGIWGLMAVGLFSADASLPIQLVGAMAIIAWAFGTSFLVFKVIDVVIGMRVSETEELIGLDHSEHGGEAYPEFVFQEQLTSNEPDVSDYQRYRRSSPGRPKSPALDRDQFTW